MNLLLVEMRRALHRRVVHVLLLLALLACVLAGIIAFTDSIDKTVVELQYEGQTHPAVLRDWWVSGNADGALIIPFFFLVLGGFFGGASVAGAEWRAGTVGTVLTWEPRRVRVHLSRTAACAILAAFFAFLVQAVFLASLLPAVLANGTTAGVDGSWWVALVGAMLRASALTAIAATLGVALATLGRNTAFAVVAVFMWVAVLEGVVRGLKPGLAGYLWGENIGTVMPWAQLQDASFERGPFLALVTLVTYSASITAIATWVFRRRDIASAS